MKVAILSESPADEAAVRVLVEAVLDEPAEDVCLPRLRSRGWPSVRQVLPGILRHVHYHTDADALVVVVDSNGTPVIVKDDWDANPLASKCRLYQLHDVLEATKANLTPVSGKAPIKTALGLAVPAVEGWYLCGANPNVSENAWVLGLQSRKQPYTKNGLKEQVYGTDRPSIHLETEKAVKAARRLAGDVAQLERRFPIGFGSLANDVRAW